MDIAWRRRWWLWPGAAAQEAHHSDSGIRRQARRCVGALLQRVIVILGEVGGHALLGRLLQHHLLESFVQGNVQEVRDQPDALALVLQASELMMQARPPWLCAWLHVCTHGMCAYGMCADGGCGVGTKHGYQAWIPSMGTRHDGGADAAVLAASTLRKHTLQQQKACERHSLPHRRPLRPISCMHMHGAHAHAKRQTAGGR